MNWQAVLRENWLYKLAAILIVFLLWLDLTAGERQSQEVITRLTVEVQDSAWVLVDAPDEVATTFQGRNRDLLAIMADEPEIRIGIPQVTGPTMLVSLDANDVIYNRELGVRATLVVPTNLELEFERLSERRVPVAADVITVPALGFTVVRPLLLDPDSVTVRGGASQIARVDHVTTRRVTLEELEHPVMRDIPVELPAGVRSVQVYPPSVLVTVPVDSLVVRQTRLPVRVLGAAADGVRIDPDTVDAVIRGAWSAVRRQLDSIPWAVVRVDEVPDAPTSLPLEVDLTSGGFVQVAPSPAEVTVRPEGP